MNNNNKASKTTTTLLLAGLATGAAAWYLFGTENGKKTFTKVSDSLKRWDSSVLNKATDAMANLKNQKDNLMS